MRQSLEGTRKTMRTQAFQPPAHPAIDAPPAMMSQQFQRFLAVGGTAALINLAARALIDLWTSYTVAIVLAYGIGMIAAFLLNRLFVFKAPASGLRHQIFWFSAVNLAALGQTLLVSLTLATLAFPALGFTWHAAELAHVAGVITPVVSSYVLHKNVTFRST